MIKKVLKIVGVIIGILLVLILGYVIYVLVQYHRIDDNQVLEIETPSISADASGDVSQVSVGQEYSVMTYNIGFGAYLQDYSFFMDGGKYSWAYSKESATQDTTDTANLAKSYDPDFFMVEEVDVDATRTYHVNELDIYNSIFSDYYSDFSVDYDSAFLMYPFTQPHGKTKAGIAVYSKFNIESAVRRSLPISGGFNKFLDLDRCYSVSKIPVDNGKYLCIYALHLSAYGNDASIRQEQVQMLCDDMEAEYEAGNYIVCGGDFNHNLKLDEDDESVTTSWACPFPRSMLPDGISFAMDALSDSEKSVLQDSARNANEPYEEGHTETFMLDGFIISDNVEMTEYTVCGTQYSYSDHDPVYMEFKLK